MVMLYLKFARQHTASVDVTRVRLKTLTVAENLRRRRCRHWRYQQAVAYTVPTLNKYRRLLLNVPSLQLFQFPTEWDPTVMRVEL